MLITDILRNNNNVINYYIDEEDNTDYMVELLNDRYVKKVIIELKKELTDNGYKVHTLFEQIDDQINEGENIISIDLFIE